jgi:hypothetical protein
MNTGNDANSHRHSTGVLVFVQSHMLPRVRWAFACTGVGLRETSSLSEALHVLASRPKLVVTCIDKAGFELFRTVRAFYPEVEVVMLENEGLCQT